MKLKIGIVGSGNLATHLAKGIIESGFSLEFIYSRNKKTGRSLSKKLQVKFEVELPDATSNPYLLFICTGDSAIQELFTQFESKGYFLPLSYLNF